MTRLVIGLALIGAGAIFMAQPSPRQVEWPYFGGDQGGQRHSPLADIDATNVSRLQPAWQWKHWEPGSRTTAPPPASSRPRR